MRGKIIAAICGALLFAAPAAAETKEARVEYSQGGQALVGYSYTNDKIAGKAPGVIIFSDWMGVGPFAKAQAKELAVLGYRVFVADVYGDAHLAKDTKEAGTLAGKFKGDRALMRARAQAAIEAFVKNAPVDPNNLAAMGFCFGGTVSLELARAGAPLKGVVSFHGGLETPNPELAKNIKGKVLVLHGEDDPYVPPAEVKAFEDEMKKGSVSWELDKYSGAVHAFTNPEAGNDNSKGAAYNETAAKRSFERMRDFFEELF